MKRPIPAMSVYIFYGGSAGLDPIDVDKLEPSDWAISSFGWQVDGAGDVDGDGFEDIVLGFPRDNQVAVYYGSTCGFACVYEDVVSYTDEDAHDDPDDFEDFGFNATGAGDVDGDGFDDIVVDDAEDEGLGENAGAAWLYTGSSRGILYGRSEKITASDGDAFDQFSDGLDGAGDLDGDGYDDLVVGAPGYLYTSAGPGSVHVYYGSCYDGDGDGVCATDDCDDEDADTYPGAAENESAADCMTDADSDGYGDTTPLSGILAGTDCDDRNPSVEPGAPEVCDARSVDEDCDGLVNDADPDLDATTGSTFIYESAATVNDKVGGGSAAADVVR